MALDRAVAAMAGHEVPIGHIVSRNRGGTVGRVGAVLIRVCRVVPLLAVTAEAPFLFARLQAVSVVDAAPPVRLGADHRVVDAADEASLVMARIADRGFRKADPTVAVAVCAGAEGRVVLRVVA